MSFFTMSRAMIYDSCWERKPGTKPETSITKALENKKSTADAILQRASSVASVVTSQWMRSFACGTLKKQPEEAFRSRVFAKQLEEVVIGLWNATVARQTAKKLEEHACSFLRQLCHDLLTSPICGHVDVRDVQDPRNNAYFHRRVMMGLKTGKSWLDACDFVKATRVLLKAREDVDTLCSLLPQEMEQDGDATTVASDPRERVKVNKHLLTALTYLAHAANGQGNVDSAVALCVEASEQTFVKDREYEMELDRLRSSTYNFALQASRDGELSRSIQWLRFNLDLSEKRTKNDDAELAQTLRLLAHVYYETGSEENLPRAMECIDKAQQHSMHPQGLHLKVKIMVKDATTEDDEIRAILSELLRHAELNIDMGLNACAYLNSNGRFDACEFGLKELLSRFAGSRHVGRVHAQRLLAAVERLPPDDAIDYVDKFFEDAELMKSVDESSQNIIQLLLWEQAAKCHDAGQMATCLSWYDLSLRLFVYGKSVNDVKMDAERASNVSKLHRNKAACYMHMGRLDEAEEAATEALRITEDCVFSYFTAFKAYVMQQKTDKAIEAIDRIMKCNESTAVTSGGEKINAKHAIVCLAAQLAFERNERDVVMQTLRHLATSGNDDSAQLTAYRCLVRLYLSMAEESNATSAVKSDCSGDPASVNPVDLGDDQPMDEDEKVETPFLEKAAGCVKDAYKTLRVIRKKFNEAWPPSDGDAIVLPGNESHVMSEEQVHKEVTWFMKIAWNLALQSKDDPSKMKSMFTLCDQLLSLLPREPSALLRQKTCLLMSAASGLALARMSEPPIARVEFQQALAALDRCREINSQLAAHECADVRPSQDKSALLLALYRYEALAKMSSSVGSAALKDLESLLGEIAQMSDVDAKTFETVAALSIEPPAYHPALHKRALRMAINKLSQKSTNGNKVEAVVAKRSALYRILIDKALDEGTSYDPSNKDESWFLFNEVYRIMQNEKWPEIEVLWLTVRCWNVGVHLYISSHVHEGEKWCSLALRFLAKLDVYKSGYETHMNVIYQEILSKKDEAEREVVM